ncbi:LacI family DNA-binding transcriptional regulator [Curtobacterium sp. 20TX0008]|uniref:LacI family DNA-binding transcriptional regulator n=1 Tax=Curtobacterium sp. 20TX0008 TaxID=3022018 RepID=UPI00232FC86C|nr:LacI family DNA-binding transcriptional regulator [Curtobacterium sp. 20TX0008]MDB6427808.1 LacI family DNA-binding transcriptional regulator [Curtobacterium sp. 20TX0008]
MTVPTNPRAVTRADVARYAGVSTSVVSYVVHDGPRPVAAETAARVREAIRVLGYRPNASAQALRTGSSKMLGLIVPELDNPFWSELAVAVTHAAAARGYDLLIANSDGDAQQERERLRTLSARQVDGIIVTSIMTHPDLSSTTDPGIPMVLLNTFFEVPEYASIGVDALRGARQGTQHLVGHGYREIGLVMGRTGSMELREQGWMQALRAAGLPDGPIVRCSFDRAGGYEAGLRMFGGGTGPRAVFVSSDLQAVGLLRALYELGLRSPDDVAVVSFDGVAEADYTNPQLTVVRQPVEAMAAAAVDRVLAREDPDDHHLDLVPAELVLGASCGCDVRR